MRSPIEKLLWATAAAAVPVALYAFSTGAPIRRTGAAVDGGLDCTACHRTFAPANSDPAGRVRIMAGNYTPGVKQTIQVIVSHPEGRRWGFSLTARPETDESQPAGTFSAGTGVQVRCDDGSLRGASPPCSAGQREFATHTSDGTSSPTPGSKTFEVEWTPPTSEVGRIVLYAAANAADSGGNNAGDRIFTTSAMLSAEGGCPQTRRPNLRTVLNGASFGEGGSINAMVSLFGLDFRPSGLSRQAGKGDFVDGKFPPELGCVAVEIDGRRAPVAYVQNDQINVQVPSTNTTGPVQVRVIVNPDRPNEMRSDVATFTLQRYSPAFFTFAPGKSIAALVAGTGTTVANPSQVPAGRPARPGEIVSLFGTGFGPTEPFYQAGELAFGLARIRDPFTVTIGGITLSREDVTYGGLSPGSISGLYQFDVRIPPTTPDGDIPVVVTIGGLQTQNGATIPVKRE